MTADHSLTITGPCSHGDLSRRFLQIIDDKFLIQIMEKPMRRSVLLDLLPTNKAGLVGDLKTGNNFGCNGHEIVEFRILQGRSRARNRIKNLVFSRANFGLFKGPLVGIPWIRALEGRGAQERLLILRHHFLQA